MTEPFDVRAGFEHLQDQLLVTLGAADLTTHPGTKGADSELKWRDALAAFLPWRYQVASAFVVDINGRRSEQLDAVIYDRQYSPLLFNIGGELHVPAESVYCVLEVKPELDKAYLGYAGDKVESVRVLERTNRQIHHAGGVYEEPLEPFTILGGIVTRKMGWASGFGAPFRDAWDGLEGDRALDIGCALEAGSFERRDDGTLRIEETDVLMSFLMGLLAKLSGMRTVPAIDIERWREVGLS